MTYEFFGMYLKLVSSRTDVLEKQRILFVEQRYWFYAGVGAWCGSRESVLKGVVASWLGNTIIVMRLISAGHRGVLPVRCGAVCLQEVISVVRS